MPDIFLSYSRSDQVIARRFAEGFEREGFSVWWDQTLRSGEAYDKVTEKALEDAKAVVVLWSKASADSRWVRSEATQADRNGTLVPVMIEQCKRPIMFELTHTAELIGWKGDPGDKSWQSYVADVRRFVQKDASIPQAPRPVVRRKRRFSRLQIAISVAALVVAGATVFWAVNGMPGLLKPGAAATATSTKAAVTLAVLPFENPDGSEAGRILAFGVAESILDQLTKLNDIAVISWDSAIGFGKEGKDSHDAAKRLGVAYLLRGNVQRDGEVLRITARLVEASTGRSIWSTKVERKQQEVFSIQDEIAAQVARELSVSVSPEGQARMRGQGTRSVEAYLAFLEGRDALSTWRTADAGKAAAHFEKALQLDPQFARAMVMLARARMRSAEYAGGPDPRVQVVQSQQEAASLVERALVLDPKMSDAYVERADLRRYEDPQAAEQDYRKAIELAPSNARAYQHLGLSLWDDPTRKAEAGPLLVRARALDPLDRELDVNYALYLWSYFGKAEEADLILRRVLEQNPDNQAALQRHGEILLYGLNRAVEAIKVFEKVLVLDPGVDTSRRFLVAAYVAIGDLDKARRVADDPQASPICRLIIAQAEHRVQEAARLAYAAFDDDIVRGADQQLAVGAIILDARRSKEYSRATAVLEDALNIVWISETEPVLGPNLGTIADVVSYAGMLRAAGDEARSQALLKVVERSMDEEDAIRGSANVWNQLARIRVSAMKPDKAATLSMLELACAGPDTLCRGGLESDPLFEPLRTEPRFKALVEVQKRKQEAARRALQSG